MCIWDKTEMCPEMCPEMCCFAHLHIIIFTILFCFTHIQQKLSTFLHKNYIAMLTESFRVSITYY